MRTGQYDGVSASGNASLQLVAAGDVDPVNVDLVPNYKTIFSDLKNQPYNTVDGVNYGIPHGRGANLLMWNTNDVKPAPDSWDVMFDPKLMSKYKGKISVYDDSDLHRRRRRLPQVPRQEPRDRQSLRAQPGAVRRGGQPAEAAEAVRRRVLVDALKQISSFANGDDQVGTTWQYQYFALKADDHPVAASPASQGFLPKEGATGWSDTWMISSKAKHPNCMYKWMNFIVSPRRTLRWRSTSERRRHRASRAMRRR